MIQERDAQLIVQCCVVLLCYPLLLSSLFIWLAITIHHVVVAVEGINVISVISISVCICCCWRWFIIVIIIGTVIKIIVVVAKRRSPFPLYHMMQHCSHRAIPRSLDLFLLFLDKSPRFALRKKYDLINAFSTSHPCCKNLFKHFHSCMCLITCNDDNIWVHLV